MFLGKIRNFHHFDRFDRMTNPFRPAPGSLPPYLAGREAELSAGKSAIQLAQSTGAPQPMVFTGLRGMGKTALLRYLAEEARYRGGLVLYGEAGDDYALPVAFRRSLERATRDLDKIPAKLRDALAKALENIPVPVYELPNGVGEIAFTRKKPQQSSLVETIEYLNRSAHEHDRFLVVCIDELQEAQIDELRTIVTYVHETAGTSMPILLLGAGLPNAANHLHKVRTYTERWRYFEIGLLKPEQTAAAISQPASNLDVAIEDAALQCLIDISAGYPFFIQEYASAAWAAHKGKTIRLADVEAIVPGVKRDLEAGFYDLRFRTLTPREVRYVLAMVDCGPGLHTVREIAEALDSTSEECSSIRNQLIRKDLIFSPAPGLVEFRMPLTDRFITAHRSSLQARANIVTKRPRLRK